MALKIILLAVSAAFISVITLGSYLELFIIDINNTLIFTVSLMILIWLVRKIVFMLRPDYKSQLCELRALRKERKRLQALKEDHDHQLKRLEKQREMLSSTQANINKIQSKNTYGSNYSSSSHSSYSSYSAPKQKESSGSGGCLVALLAIIYMPLRVIFTLMSGFMKKK